MEGLPQVDEKDVCEEQTHEAFAQMQEQVKKMSADWVGLSNSPIALRIAKAHIAQQHYCAILKKLQKEELECCSEFESFAARNAGRIQLGSGVVGVVGSSLGISALAAAVPTSGASLFLLFPGIVLSVISGLGGMSSVYVNEHKLRESLEALEKTYKAFFSALDNLFRAVEFAKRFAQDRPDSPSSCNLSSNPAFGKEPPASLALLNHASAGAGIAAKVVASVDRLVQPAKNVVGVEKLSVKTVVKLAVASKKVVASTAKSAVPVVSLSLRVGGIALCGVSALVDIWSIVEGVRKLNNREKMKSVLEDIHGLINFCLTHDDAKILLEANDAASLVENCESHEDLINVTRRSPAALTGGGKTSYVWFATYRKEQVVIKAFKSDEDVPRDIAESEYKTLQSLKHSNIVAFKDFFKDDEGKAYLVFELCSGGTLHDWLHEYPRDSFLSANIEPLPWVSCYVAFQELFGVLHYLHAQGILHGDVKPANMGFDNNNTMKLLDFGLSRSSLELLENRGQSSMRGTPFYPPKWFLESQRSQDPRQVHTAFDVGCAGSVILETVFGTRISCLDENQLKFKRRVMNFAKKQEAFREMMSSLGLPQEFVQQAEQKQDQANTLEFESLVQDAIRLNSKFPVAVLLFLTKIACDCREAERPDDCPTAGQVLSLLESVGLANCVVCRGRNDCSLVFLPCKHNVACLSCLRESEDLRCQEKSLQKCFVCRAQIEMLIDLNDDSPKSVRAALDIFGWNLQSQRKMTSQIEKVCGNVTFIASQ
eukprot:TRINITY_DN1634_c0_g1_i12.p1 TRINITY_DN1634_c0_g1~~TRINITY_DN1634_c0_g1_i12.p1  ORF type:complete len:767 (+),score=202.47 TRINITY_DN1634_c0_g1_i12:1317-3617(+)